MSKTLAHVIRERIGGMTKSERQVARALLANYPLLGLRTVADVAAESGVSAPTVLRFVARLDLDSYPAFQERLHAELEHQIKTPLEKADPTGEPPESEMAAALTSNLRRTIDDLLEADVAGAIELLSSNRRPVFLTGGRFTDSMASYMAAHLALMRPGVHHVDPALDRRRDSLLDMGKSTTLVAFDIRRYDPELVAFAGEAVREELEVVLFTDQWLSPVSQIATHVLSAQVEVPSIWDSNAAVMATVEVVLARVAHTIWPQTRERLRDLEQLRAEPTVVPD